jgi:L-amino acid N-acyltransferase YncA
VKIRGATEHDATAVAEIYAPAVAATAISFELEPPTATEMARRIAQTITMYPWLVYEDADGTVMGFARAARFRERPAYQWSVEVSAYVRRDAHRRGIGRRLYETLLPLLAKQRFCTAYAGIALPNAASIGLHESLGFVPVGVFRGAGYKLGAWHDVGWWQRPLHPLDPDPALPIPYPLVK